MTKNDQIKLKEEFIERLKRCTADRPGAEKMLEYLESTDFFTAPSSAGHHSNFAGGLTYHSLLVDDCITKLYNTFKGDRMVIRDENSLHIVALLHDVCKVNYYVRGTRNVKDKLTGKWIEKRIYEVKDEFPVGHGEKSVILILSHMQLTEEEIMAIRWHMGAYDAAIKGGDRAMYVASEKYPMVTLLHLADMMASQIYEETIE